MKSECSAFKEKMFCLFTNLLLNKKKTLSEYPLHAESTLTETTKTTFTHLDRIARFHSIGVKCCKIWQ